MIDLTEDEKKTLEYISERMLVWQKRLGLSDWNIRVRFGNAVDMDQRTGRCKRTANVQTADIQLMRPNDRQMSDMNDDDIELSLVHELVHVRIWSFEPMDIDGPLYSMKEQSIEWLAKGLLESERCAKLK